MKSLDQKTSNNQMDGDEISLKELIVKIKEWVTYLITKWKLIIAISAIGGIFGFVYASFQKPTFKAVMTFVLDEEQSSNGSVGGIGIANSLGLSIGSSSGGGLFKSSNILDLMKSRLVIEKTLLSSVKYYGNGYEEKITLAEYYIRFNNLRNSWKSNNVLKFIRFNPNEERSKFSVHQDSILEVISSTIIKNNLLIGPTEKTSNFNSIEVNSKDELFSKLFCEQLVKVISNFYIETKSRKARQNVDMLQKETDSIRSELNSGIVSVANSNDEVYNLNPSMNVKRTTGAKKQIDVQINTSILSQLITQLQAAKVSLRKETPLIQVIDQPILPLQKSKLSRLNSLFIGGLLASFLSILFLIFRKLNRKLVA